VSAGDFVDIADYDVPGIPSSKMDLLPPAFRSVLAGMAGGGYRAKVLMLTYSRRICYYRCRPSGVASDTSNAMTSRGIVPWGGVVPAGASGLMAAAQQESDDVLA
jgi:hypothetical protein